MTPLRIAQVAPLARGVGPDEPSSIEQLVWLLTEGLVARGHAVTLFASGDSQTSARLSATYAKPYLRDSRRWGNWQFHELVHAAAAFERADEFDVIHSHVYAFPAPLARLVATPVVHTDHLPTAADVAACYAGYPQATVVAVSAYHRRKLAAVPGVRIVPNAVDFAAFPAGRGGDDLVFVGHLIPRKGVVEAITVARRAGRRLVLAGKGQGDYYESQVAPLLDGEQVVWLGPIGVAERNRLLAGAGALLFASLSAEPFGLVMLEAMACGTPVAALERCAVPEVVEAGVTGWYAPDVGALAARIDDVVALDRRRVRAAARRRFDAARMVDGYERLYRELTTDRGRLAG